MGGDILYRDTTPDAETTEKILQGCKPLAPELLDGKGEFEVLSVPVGLRPARKGGPRVEVEVVVEGETKPQPEKRTGTKTKTMTGTETNGEGERKKEAEGEKKRWTVVHCYGHAGAG